MTSKTMRAALLLGSAFALLGASQASALPRSTTDRIDDVTGEQVHVVYALPSDGEDRALDTNGTLENSVGSFQTWLRGQTAGRELRIDRLGGELDITFLRLSKTDAEIAALDPRVRDELETQLHAAGFDHPDKIYAVYYDGTSNFACGGGAYPPDLPGDVAAMYLNGLPNSSVPCRNNPFAGAGDPPGYMEYAMLHEALHTLGFVPACAPHQRLRGHVSDDANDLMWAGTGNWLPGGYGAAVLDSGRDDYYRAGIAGCPDLDTNAFMTTVAAPDSDAPTVTCASPDGVWHGANVSLHCTASDSGSGLASSADADFSLSTSVAAGEETANAATGARDVCDVAGNCAKAGPIGGNRVDRKGPSVTIASPQDGGSFQVGQSVVADYACDDVGSGLASCAGTVSDGDAIDTSSVGHNSFSVAAADSVGNPTSRVSGYDVVYGFAGFFEPVDKLPTLNAMKAGSSVPVKFSLHGDYGLGVLAGTPTSERIACDSSAPLDSVEVGTSSGAGLTYDATQDQYVYVWKTSAAWRGSCRQLTVRLADGTAQRANFRFR